VTRVSIGLSLLSARICHSNGCLDPLRQWMFGGHRIWGLFPVRPSIDPTFGVDSLKLFLKSLHHTRITWHLLPWQTRFDSVVCLARITAPNLLLFQTLIVVVALVLFWTVVKLCVDWCYCCCTVCVCCCCCCVCCSSCCCSYALFCCPLDWAFCCDVCHFFYPLCKVLSPSLICFSFNKAFVN
jgi:hypothetical protein